MAKGTKQIRIGRLGRYVMQELSIIDQLFALGDSLDEYQRIKLESRVEAVERLCSQFPELEGCIPERQGNS